MRFKPIVINGVRYRIVPSLENMCNLEEETGVNLILGVNPDAVNLRFMRAVISNLIEDEQGNHISVSALDTVYQSDVSLAQDIFTKCYAEMYTLPSEADTKKAVRRNAIQRKRKRYV